MNQLVYHNVYFKLFDDCKCRVTFTSHDDHIIRIVKRDNNNIYTAYQTIITINEIITNQNQLFDIISFLKGNLNSNNGLESLFDIDYRDDELLLELTNEDNKYIFKIEQVELNSNDKQQYKLDDRNIIIRQLNEQLDSNKHEIIRQAQTMENQNKEIIHLKESFKNEILELKQLYNNEITNLKNIVQDLSKEVVNYKYPSNIEEVYHIDHINAEGIIHFIGTQGRRVPYSNPHTSKYISVTTNTTGTPIVERVFNKDSNQSFCFIVTSNPWIMIDLGDRRKARITSLSLCLFPQFSHRNERHYEIAVSNYGLERNDWVTISVISNDKGYDNSPKTINNFACNNPSNEFYRYIRLRQVSVATCNKNFPALSGPSRKHKVIDIDPIDGSFVLSGLELYGDLSIRPPTVI